MNKDDRYNAKARPISVRLHKDRDAEVIEALETESERQSLTISAMAREVLRAWARRIGK
jgi:hypothetical protein